MVASVVACLKSFGCTCFEKCWITDVQRSKSVTPQISNSKLLRKLKKVGNQAAARQFQVVEKCVQQWRKANRFRNLYWPTLKENLLKWIKNMS